MSEPALMIFPFPEITNCTCPALGTTEFSFLKVIGGFSIEIKTEIRYHIICCYHNFIRQNYDNSKLYDILFWL